jgi:hypothetical protein
MTGPDALPVARRVVVGMTDLDALPVESRVVVRMIDGGGSQIAVDYGILEQRNLELRGFEIERELERV